MDWEPQEPPTDLEAETDPRRRRLLIYLLPNLFTTANLFCGYFSVVHAIRGDWYSSAMALFVAALLDGVDGRIARLTKTQSLFGEQYDSMSDLVSFGIAPAPKMNEHTCPSITCAPTKLDLLKPFVIDLVVSYEPALQPVKFEWIGIKESKIK